MEQAAGLLARAERPLVIAGGGVAVSGAAPELRSLAERLGAAAAATQMGLGCVSTAGPAFFGHGGVIGGEAVVRALTEADAVLAVGCRFSSWLSCGPGEGVRGRPHQELVQVDVDPAVIGRYRPVDVGLQGDAKAVLAQLLEAVDETGRACSPWVGSLVEQYGRYRDELRAAAAVPGEAMHPAALAEEIGAWLPDDSLVVYDGGHTSFWSNDLTPATEPRTRFHEPGMAHRGFGTPYAHALKLLHPERTVLSINGDGGFGFTLQELDTARRHGIAAVHVIHDNAAWGVIRLGQGRAGFELGTDLSGDGLRSDRPRVRLPRRARHPARGGRAGARPRRRLRAAGRGRRGRPARAALGPAAVRCGRAAGVSSALGLSAAGRAGDGRPEERARRPAHDLDGLLA